MDLMTNKQFNQFQNFFSIRQASLLKILTDFLVRKYGKDRVVISSDYLMAFGDEEYPVALVAHLDTVFSDPPKNIYYDQRKHVVWSPEGLGADDRAGVYIITQLIQKGYRPTVIFTTEEECGALGARKLTDEYPVSPVGLKFIIELDRRGEKDCVFYNCDNEPFVNYISTFGFEEEYGTFTDISIICPRWHIAGVNLSVGYFSEHTYQEILNLDYMIATMNKVANILEQAKTAEHYEYIPGPVYGAFGPDVKRNWLTDTYFRCYSCGDAYFEEELLTVKKKDGTKVFFCLDCLTKAPEVEWCRKCGDAFLFDTEEDRIKGQHFCYDCLKDKETEDKK